MSRSRHRSGQRTWVRVQSEGQTNPESGRASMPNSGWPRQPTLQRVNGLARVYCRERTLRQLARCNRWTWRPGGVVMARGNRTKWPAKLAGLNAKLQESRPYVVCCLKQARALYRPNATKNKRPKLATLGSGTTEAGSGTTIN